MAVPVFAQLFDFGIVLPVLVMLVVMGVLMFVVRQYRRCPSNRVLVMYGKVGGQQAARCIHGGGVFVVPLFQDYQYLSLEPMTIDIELAGALSKKNIRVNGLCFGATDTPMLRTHAPDLADSGGCMTPADLGQATLNLRAAGADGPTGETYLFGTSGTPVEESRKAIAALAP